MNVKRCLIELLSSSPKSIQQLLELTKLPERTLRYHLAILRRDGILREAISFTDRRRKTLSIFKQCDVYFNPDNVDLQ